MSVSAAPFQSWNVNNGWENLLSWPVIMTVEALGVVAVIVLARNLGLFYAKSHRRLPVHNADGADRPVDEAIESLRALAETPGCDAAATSLAEIVKGAVKEIGDDTKLENIIRAPDGSDTAAANAVMTAWQQHVQHSPAVTSPATAQHLCDRMDELTARTRQDLNAEGKE
ncbi:MULTISPECIES: hypothetical protein [Rhodococcus erythropolis group]|uniref:Uncharacterized protein n=1 Tax=Rhodococcus erythropolis TaxID=1833 RepID=A0A8I0ZRD3_RHOER|nr:MULTISPECIES: hypothetical protein [Rhodococcus erythropolis group]MBH5144231.1 hypothetical protein [Rhodococcus erythropolis]MDJ0434687.1 hypothetical protein [Rhodococcus qingshengii]QEM25730.1 hypothetical protein D6M20_02505 [Rhodococcus qingshengii]